MRILLLAHSFNSLTQRIHVELAARGHEVSLELDIADRVLQEAVELYSPDLIIAPFLRRAIPDSVWRRVRCLIVHPGPPGDRGPSALDWAIRDSAPAWGVTVLQAEAELDGGPVWASESFPMRAASKSSLYRREVTEAATRALLRAIERVQSGETATPPPPGRWRPLMGQADRAVDWNAPTSVLLAQLRAADGAPGLLDTINGESFYLYDACEEDRLRGTPGTLLARRHNAICRATGDGALWIGHLKRHQPGGERQLKLPATHLLGAAVHSLPEVPAPLTLGGRITYTEIHYEETDGVGWLHFPFYNGAMSTAQCERLREAYRYATTRDTRVIVLMGGSDFWSNGLHLNLIEAAASPADESWRNINAMNDLVHAILTTETHLTVAAMQGNAGAGGLFLALAADQVIARSGVVLNPHYRNMGNLYGSEYWTYLLPKRVGSEGARAIMEGRLPMGAPQAAALGLIDGQFGADPVEFREEVQRRAHELAHRTDYAQLLAQKRSARAADEACKPLAAYREEELKQMRANFYGFDPSYHVARYNFVFRVPHSRTPLHLARHRQRLHGS